MSGDNEQQTFVLPTTEQFSAGYGHYRDKPPPSPPRCLRTRILRGAGKAHNCCPI